METQRKDFTEEQAMGTGLPTAPEAVAAPPSLQQALADMARAQTWEEGVAAYNRALSEVTATARVTPARLPAPEPRPSDPKEELRQAKQAHWGFVLLPDDPSTWPAEMQERRAHLQANGPTWADWDYDEYLFDMKQDILLQVVLQNLGDDYYFVEGAIAHFLKRLPAGSVESALAHELEMSVYFLLKDAVGTCMRLVPKLERLLPWEDPGEIYAAMMGDEGETSEEGTNAQAPA